MKRWAVVRLNLALPCGIVLLLGTPSFLVASDQEDSRIPTETLSVEGGWLRDYRAGNTDALYYFVDYRGKRVRAQGTPISRDLPSVNPEAQIQDPAGDAEDLVLRLERGNVASKSAIYDLLGTRPLSFTAPRLMRLRGTAQLTGRLDGRVFNVAAGLETPPFHPLRELNRHTPSNITNWVIIGVQGEHRESHQDSIVNTSAGLVNVRIFLGRGFFWGWSKKLTGTNKDLIRDVLAIAGTFDAAKQRVPAIQKRYRQGLASPAEVLIYTIAEEGDDLQSHERRDPDRWKQAVSIAATSGKENTPRDQPRLILWTEGFVWREFGGERRSDAWLNRAVLTARVMPFPREADAIWIDVRYTNGYERADHKLRRNQLAAAVGVKL